MYVDQVLFRGHEKPTFYGAVFGFLCYYKAIEKIR